MSLVYHLWQLIARQIFEIANESATCINASFPKMTRHSSNLKDEKMKKLMFALLIMSAASYSFATETGWISYVIRNANSGGAAPTINTIDTSKEFVINEGGMKAAWGTDAINGATIGQITELSIDRLDTNCNGSIYAPYFNIWITNGSGKYAVIANEPSNPEWTGDSEHNIMGWNMLKTKTAKVFEAAPSTEAGYANWVYESLGKSSGLTFADFENFVIQAPSAAYINTGTNNVTSGAPREILDHTAYGFNWIFGDTLANYVSGTGSQGYVVANPVATAVPEPGTFVLLAIGGLFLACVYRRR
jgi:hypothetical protein